MSDQLDSAALAATPPPSRGRKKRPAGLHVATMTKAQKFEYVAKQWLGLVYLTTGHIAALCSTAPRTVSKWFDSGRLRGMRIPGSRDRRVSKDQFLTFLRESGWTDLIERIEGFSGNSVLYFGTDGDQCIEKLGAGYTVHRHLTDYEVVYALSAVRPFAIIIDFVTARNPATFAEKVSALSIDPKPFLIGIGPTDVLGQCEYLDVRTSDLDFLATDLQAHCAK